MPVFEIETEERVTYDCRFKYTVVAKNEREAKAKVRNFDQSQGIEAQTINQQFVKTIIKSMHTDTVITLKPTRI